MDNINLTDYLVIHRTGNCFIDTSLHESKKNAKDRFERTTKGGWNSDQYKPYKAIGNHNEFNPEIFTYYNDSVEKIFNNNQDIISKIVNDNKISDIFGDKLKEDPLPKKIILPKAFYKSQNYKGGAGHRKVQSHLPINKISFNENELLYTPSLKQLMKQKGGSDELKRELQQSFYRVNAAKRGQQTSSIMAKYNVFYYSPKTFKNSKEKSKNIINNNHVDKSKLNKSTAKKPSEFKKKYTYNYKNLSCYETPKNLFTEDIISEIPRFNLANSRTTEPLIKLYSLKEVINGIQSMNSGTNKSKSKSFNESMIQMMKDKKIVLSSTLNTKLNSIESKFATKRKNKNEGNCVKKSDYPDKVEEPQNKNSIKNIQARFMSNDNENLDMIKPIISRIINDRSDRKSNLIYSMINKCKTFYKQKLEKHIELFLKLKAIEKDRPYSTGFKKSFINAFANPLSQDKDSKGKTHSKLSILIRSYENKS